VGVLGSSHTQDIHSHTDTHKNEKFTGKRVQDRERAREREREFMREKKKEFKERERESSRKSVQESERDHKKIIPKVCRSTWVLVQRPALPPLGRAVA
jgi:transposase